MTTASEVDKAGARSIFEIGAVEAVISFGDAIQGMAEMAEDSIDLAIVDPPYGASTSQSFGLPRGHGLAGFGGEWRIAGHEWDKITGSSSFELTFAYLEQLKRVVKPTGSFFVHSTYHNSGIVNVACQVLGIEILNEIVWYKRNAFPNLANRRLTASHETIHWAHTGTPKNRAYRFNADEVKASSFANDGLKAPGKQMRTVWDVPNNKDRSELAHGKHPTQKPLSIVERLLLVAGVRDGRLLVPFAGSGSELVAGAAWGMNVYGFEIEREFFELACRRLQALKDADPQLPIEG